MSALLPPLPIESVLPRLRAALEAHSGAVLVAPPGAGKTTRVPLDLLDASWRGKGRREGRREGRIIVLEPRRLAARAAAARMAHSLGESVGERIGLRVRMDTKITARTEIEVVTEGVFTRMILADPLLEGIAAVIFDEFHERSLDADLGLALAREVQGLRPELRLLVMSATIEGGRVAALLDGAPVIESAGRAFPIALRHRPVDPRAPLEEGVVAAIRHALGADEGSILVFLPGQAEIARVERRLAGTVPADVDVAPLYGRLPPEAQDRALRPAPAGRRKIVLATPVAQTSLTIEDVRVVIDSGLQRVPSYAPDTGMTRLVTRRVSRAGADQRAGRAGRTAPGVAYRLWHEGQTGALAPYDRPEILDADLSGLVLDLADWGVHDANALAFLDPPPGPAVAEARALLVQLGALDAQGTITAEGRTLSRLPLHPRLGRMLRDGVREGDGTTPALVAALLGEFGIAGSETDLRHRLAHLAGTKGFREREAVTLARRWVQAAGGQWVAPRPHAAARHLARAYPDRVAQAAGAPGRFRLANGRGARLAPHDPLAGETFLAVAEVSGSDGADGIIRLAAPLDRAEIEELFADRIEIATVLAFDASAGAVRARRRARLGALVLDDAPVPITDWDEAARMLAHEAAKRGLDRLAWSREQRALRGRAGVLHAASGPPFPDLSDAALADAPERWLAPALVGLSRLSEIGPDRLAAALELLVPYATRRAIEAGLPSHFTAPSGSRVPIDYDDAEGPSLSIRVQELFGLTLHPAVAGGRLPLRLVLLSPAQRPIQTTQDLPGFWAGSWHEVAKEMRGRYPRHFWPDDPARAQATARAKPRRDGP